MSDPGPVLALGAMSGTSMDGVDAAVVETDGRTISGFGETGYRAYTDAERAAIRAALGRDAPVPAVRHAAEVVETAHAVLLSGMPGDVVGFHGQTLWHDPAAGMTCQTGDGDVLAEVLGRPVVWDFRSSDMELGGQGAPLAPFYHHACARWAGFDAPVAFLNLGGVGNLTWVDPRAAAPEAAGACLAFDTGPANGPIDDLVAARLGRAFDADGALAAGGRVAQGVPERFLDHGYFRRIPPKSLDRKDFPELARMVADLSDADAAATLAAVAAASVMAGMEHCPTSPERVLVTGGGRKNPVLMDMVAAGLDCPVGPVEEVGLDGDMLEAQAFGYLAVRVMRGMPTTAPGTTGVAAPVGGGRVSRPGPPSSG